MAREKLKPMENHIKVLNEACFILKFLPFPADKSQRTARRMKITNSINEVVCIK